LKGGVFLSNIRYRRGGRNAADMARYARLLSEENSNTGELDRVKQALRRALREEITEKQREYLYLYYSRRMNMKEIGERFGVDKSTVSRTIKRGEERLRRCVRYGARRLLLSAVVK